MKKFLHLLLILLMLITLTSCWSAHELTEIAIATALGIDKTEDGYRVTVQIINPGEIASQNQTTRVAVSIYTIEGKTLFETIRKLTTIAPRKLYLSHLRVILFGEEFAKEGIKKPLDFLARDHEVRADFVIAISKGMTAEDQLKVLTPLEKIPANKIYSAIKDSEQNWAPTKVVILDDLIGALVSEGKEPIITGIEVLGDPEKGNTLENVEKVKSSAMIKINHLGVFKGDKLIDWLTESESKGFNYITDNVTSTIGFIECEDGGTVAKEVFQSKTKMEAYTKNGEPKIKLSVETEANIADVECSVDVTDHEKLEELEKKFAKKTEKVMEESIAKAKELKSDIFGFGEAIERSNPKLWGKLKDNWDDEFATLDIEIRAEVHLRRLGTITESFQDK